ncbi:MAG: class III signal peptide-containing protein [archaeon]
MKRGQAALEFIFLILVVVVYIVTVTMPLSRDTQSALSDVETLSRANNETQKIMNSINELSIIGEGSKQTLTLFIPENTFIYCTDTNISYEVKLKQTPYPIQCSSGTCRKTFLVPSTITLNCSLQLITGPTKMNLVLEKSAAKIAFTQGS